MTSTTLPIATGPLIPLHRAAGATIETVDGWEIAVRYPDEPEQGTDAVVDRSHRPVHEINGPQTGAILESICGCNVALRTIHVGENLHIYRLTETRAILFGILDTGGQADQCHPTVDVTGGWTTLALYGPNARIILNKISALDLRDKTLPIGHCCQGPVSGIGTLIGRYRDRYELHACPDVLEFLWEVILDAGNEYGLKPAGTSWSAECGVGNAE